MAPSVLLFRSHRRGSVPPAVPVAAVRAALFSGVGSALAGMVHHLAFDSNPSWGARILAALVLFGVALPGAGQETPLRRQVLLSYGTQLAVGWWFVLADDSTGLAPHGEWPSAVHAGAPVVVAHLALTLLCAILLHGLGACRRRVLYAAGRDHGALGDLVRRLFAPLPTPCDMGLGGGLPRLSPLPARASPVAFLLTDEVVRRGPPSPRPLAV
ncbi:hypothetical protein [Streptomyces sp. NPDC021622]|uniref:hypothetical protein n=1 Tax=Streptomyces sp. NPDC021622 TaxID=3155013 RepID=UPI0033FC3B9D